MSSILVRDLDFEILTRLKKRAQSGGRSLQSEVKEILEEASKVDYDHARQVASHIRSQRKGKLYSDSTELVREDRDR